MAQRRSSDEGAAIVGRRTLVPLDGGVLVEGDKRCGWRVTDSQISTSHSRQRSW